MAIKNTIEKRLTTPVKILLAFVKLSDKYFPFFARQIVLSRFYRPFRFSKNLYYPPIFQQSQKFILSIKKQKIVCYSWGKGPVVLLCHGWSGWAGQMGEFVQPLLEKGFRVIAFDGPAHGNSPGKKTNQLEFVDSMKEINTLYGPITAIIGHSFGGVCTLMALKEGITTKKAVIIGTPASLPFMVEETRKNLGVSKHTISVIPHHIKNRTGKDYDEFSAEHIAKSVQASVLVIHDKDDTDVRYQDAETLSALLKNSSILLTTGKGHRRVLRDKEVIETVVKYIVSSIN